MEPTRTIWLNYEPSDEQWEELHRAADEVFVQLGELVVFRYDRPLDLSDFTRDLFLRAGYEPECDPTLPDDWPSEQPQLPSVCPARASFVGTRCPRGCIRNRGPPILRRRTVRFSGI